MPPRPQIDQLPEDIRIELATGLKGSGWGDIDGWTAWLAERGYQISRAAVGRFSKKNKERFESAWADAEQTSALAKILVANKQDDAGAMLQANEMLAADGLMRMQMAMRDLEQIADTMEDDEAATGLKLALVKANSGILRGVADLNRAGIARAKWQTEINAKLQKAATASEQIAKKAGLSDEDWALIRAKFLGVEIEL